MDGLDTKVDNIEGWLKGLQNTVNNLSEIVHSWKGERRVYMLVLAGLHMIIGVALIGIWSMISDIKTDIGGEALRKERAIGNIKAEVEVIKVRHSQLIKEFTRLKAIAGKGVIKDD